MKLNHQCSYHVKSHVFYVCVRVQVVDKPIANRLNMVVETKKFFSFFCSSLSHQYDSGKWMSN